MEIIVKTITQPKLPKTKNEFTKICNELGISLREQTYTTSAKNWGWGVLGSNVVPEVFDYDSGTNGTFQLFLEGDQGIFEVRKHFAKLQTFPASF